MGSPKPQETVVTLIADEQEVSSHLEEMGLTLAGLQRVISRGAGGYASTTEFHASSAPGIFLYHELTAALRRLVMPLGWEMDEEDGQPRVYRPETGTAIVVQTGDEYTGIDGNRQPTTRHPKGSATHRKVTQNESQLALFPLPAQPWNEHAETGVLTWVLLVSISGDTVHAELALPRQMTGGKPTGWLVRILLPEQSLGGSPVEVAVPDHHGERSDDMRVEWRN
jgi:hypothetical protein